MNLERIGAFTIMVTLLTMMPGPNGALLLRTVPTLGRAAGAMNLAGIVSAFGLHGAFSIVGLSAIILSSAEAFFTIKLIGAIYLIYLGAISLWKAIRIEGKNGPAKTKQTKTVNNKASARFSEGLVTNLLNPKVSMFYLAAFPQFINFSSSPYLEAFILVLIHSIIVIAWFSLIIFALSSAAQITKSEKFQRTIQGVTGTLLVWFGYRLLVYEQKLN